MRVFSEPEIAQILQRAADRQAEAARAVPTTGLTLGEIEALAAEAGLDVAHVRAAAAELAPVSPAERSRSATHVFVERTLEVPLTDAGWDEAVAELRNRFGKAGMAAYAPGNAPSGEVTVVGKNREWSHTDGLGVETRVLATDRGATARLRISQRVGMMSELGDGVLVGGLFGMLPALLAFNLLPGVGIAAALAVLALSIFLVWMADVAWRKKKHAQLADLSDDLAALLAANSPAESTRQAAAEPASSASPALSLDALGDAPEAERDASERNRSGSRT